MPYMSRYFISLFFGMLFTLGISQESKPIDLQSKDTIQRTERYGLRVGIDLSRPILSFIDNNYTGLEFVGDYRLKDKLYIAAEIGNEERTQTEDLDGIDLYNYTTNGSYIKLGVDHNTYKNWFGEQNLVTIGGRLAFSSFSQTLNNFRIYETNRDFNEETFFQLGTEPQEFSGRTAAWLEFVLGYKARLFGNLYGGVSIRLAYLVSNSDEEGFPNLWIPGFNKVTDGSNFGVGYNYTISYFLPLYKKAKKKKKEMPNSN